MIIQTIYVCTGCDCISGFSTFWKINYFYQYAGFILGDTEHARESYLM